jgi:hypothetical protein
MKTRVDLRFRAEATRYAFRFACDDCAHFDDSLARGPRCSLGFAAAPRLDALDAATFESCKTFELA